MLTWPKENCVSPKNQTEKKWRRCVLLLLRRGRRRRGSRALKIYKKHENLLSESNNIINIFIANLNLIAAGQKIQTKHYIHTHTDTPTQRRFVTCASELCKLIIYCQNTNKIYTREKQKYAAGPPYMRITMSGCYTVRLCLLYTTKTVAKNYIIKSGSSDFQELFKVCEGVRASVAVCVSEEH